MSDVFRCVAKTGIWHPRHCRKMPVQRIGGEGDFLGGGLQPASDLVGQRRWFQEPFDESAIDLDPSSHSSARHRRHPHCTPREYRSCTTSSIAGRHFMVVFLRMRQGAADRNVPASHVDGWGRRWRYALGGVTEIRHNEESNGPEDKRRWMQQVQHRALFITRSFWLGRSWGRGLNARQSSL